VGAWSAVAAFDFLLLAGRWGGAGAVSPWDTAADAAMLLPLVLVLGVRGLAGGLDRRRRVVVRATAGFALAASAALAWGGVQLALSPGAPGTAGRLRLLRDAMAEAAAVAGEDGWIVLAVGAGRPDEQASLADLQPDHWTWTQAPAEAVAKGAGRALLPFPAASFQAGHSVAVVAEAGSTGAIQTFDGAGIYRQELVGQHGPYVVLRAQRPDGAGAASDR
jgi:hypothetical protein